MTRLGYLLMVWVVCGCVTSFDGDENGFVQPLDFGSIFDNKDSGVASLASSPMTAAILNVDKNQYPKLFDTVVSSSIDSLQTRVAPRESVFDANNFGFNPIASQSFIPYRQSAKLIAQPLQQTNPNAQKLSPLRYDIRTVHDPIYRIYKDEENEEGKEILASLKKNPTVAAYFKPTVNVEVEHPIKYRKEDMIEKFEGDQNYKQNPYIAGPVRIRRYTRGRSRESLKKSEDDEGDDPYNYKAEYISQPKAFDESPYSSPYKKKDSEEKYEYPYNYDSGYDHKEYERIKDLSEKQAAEIRQNPGNCKEVKRDGMTCMTCKDPKTGGNYESCAYVTEPKNNKYAYSKERKFDSNDEPDEEEDDVPKKAEKIQESKVDDTAPQKFTPSDEEKPYSSYRQADKDDSGEKYKAFYVHTSKPKTSEALRTTSDEDSEETKSKPYDYKKAIPGFYTDNEPKKDVEHVLAEFKKKDRSSCKKVQKNAMTCFQCVDKNGLKHEECMFVSESAPKKSHLAYQELKEFTSKPATLDGGNEPAESQTVTTSAPAQKSAAYVAASSNYGKKLKRKKAPQSEVAAAATNTEARATHKIKRSKGSEAESNAQIYDDSKIASPEEFAGADSKGAFWAETVPRYSAALGVSLPEYMLSRSEHEAAFDEAIAGA